MRFTDFAKDTVIFIANFVRIALSKLSELVASFVNHLTHGGLTPYKIVAHMHECMT